MRLRDWFVVLTLATALPGPAAAADKPATAGDAVYLEYREPKNVSDADAPPPFLAHELMRQAFLIAARDECGLRTVDATLGEKSPDSSSLHVVPFDLHCKVARVKGFDVRYALSRTNGKATEKLGEWSFITDVFSPNMVTNLADLAERMSRGKLKNLLNQQKLTQTGAASPRVRRIPQHHGTALGMERDFPPRHLRRIHSEIRTKGESPELVAGLAVGYANLGSVTDTISVPCTRPYFRGPCFMPNVWCTRATGRIRHVGAAPACGPSRALTTRPASTSRRLARRGTKKTSRRPPFWADILEAFCDGQLPKMMEVAKNHQEQTLARYLKMLAVVHSDFVTVTIQACTEDSCTIPPSASAQPPRYARPEIGPMRHGHGIRLFPPFRLTASPASRCLRTPGIACQTGLRRQAGRRDGR